MWEMLGAKRLREEGEHEPVGTQGPVAVCLVKTTETAEASTHAFRLHVARSRISDKLTTSESFEACRQAWKVSVQAVTHNKQQILGTYLHFEPSAAALVQTAPVRFTLTVAAHPGPGMWYTRQPDLQAGLGPSYDRLPSLRDLDDFTLGLLDEQDRLQLDLVMQVPLPPKSFDRPNLTLALDGGQRLCAHKTYLEHRSTVLAKAIDPTELNSPAGKASAPAEPLVVKVPQTSPLQACLLLQVLHSPRPESWTKAQSLSNLLELAQVAHFLDCASVLHICEEALVTKCAAGTLQVAKVKSHYWLAHRLGLDAFGLQCATYILRNIERLSPEDTEGLGALLRVLKTARVILPG